MAGHEGNNSSAPVANGAVPGQPDAVLWAYGHKDALDSWHARPAAA